jgi:amidase
MAREVMTSARDYLRDLLSPGTMLILPTTPCAAPLLDASLADMEAFRARTMNLTCIAGLGGLPQLSIPACSVNDCSVGISLLGWRGADEELLDVAVRLGPFCAS